MPKKRAGIHPFWNFSTPCGEAGRDPVQLHDPLPLHGWGSRLGFTVGVHGSISNVDRTEPLSFMSTLKALGITSQINLEKIRKVVAKRTFEAHDLLRSFYAVKFSSSSHVDQTSHVLWAARSPFSIVFGFSHNPFGGT